MSLLRAAAAALSLAALARADVIHVPGDFASLQDAVDSAAPGDEIVIAPGDYEGIFLVDGKQDLLIHAQGKVTLLGSVPGSANLRVQASSQVVLEGLRVSGSEGDGLQVADSDQIQLRHCRVEGSAEDGIDVQDSHGVVLEHVLVSGSTGAGVRTATSTGVFLSRCTILGGDTGVDIADGVGYELDRVTVAGTADRGIALGASGVAGASDAIVFRCRVLDAGGVGIVLNGTGLLVERSRIDGAAGAGLLVLDGACIVRDNRIVAAGIDGLDVVGGAHQLLGNRIVKAGLNGLKADHAGLQFVSGNRIVQAGDVGMVLDDGNDGSVLTDNLVTHSPNGLDVFSDDVKVSGNRAVVTAHVGFFVLGSGGLFTGNHAQGSGDFDLLDQSLNGNTYVDNAFGTTQID